MDCRRYMIIAKGEIVTSKVSSCNFNSNTGKFDITFNNGFTYSYSKKNVIFMANPRLLKPDDYIIETVDGKRLFDINWIYEFVSLGEIFWHLEFRDFDLDYKKSELIIKENCLKNEKSIRTFEYLKEVSALSEIRNDNNERILKKYYNHIDFIADTSALSKFLNQESEYKKKSVENIIFPFGCNKSQFIAVKSAMENKISVIQGPPGTGKTQTILNIIANIISSGMNVAVVSNNNAAALNVLEKLERYNLDFLVATLGNSANKSNFIVNQTGKYPDLSDWKIGQENKISPYEINRIAERLQSVYELQEQIAVLKEQEREVTTESQHFFAYVDDTGADYNTIKLRRKISSDKIMRLWQELQNHIEDSKRLTLLDKLKSIFVYGIADWNFYRQDLCKIITVLQGMYYNQTLREIHIRIQEKETCLRDIKGDYDKQLEEKSLKYLKDYLATKLCENKNRKVFTDDDLIKNSKQFISEYPIILSTTFSARSSLNKLDYDYVIIDEASQVDIATGALALSCAKHAVIVGDIKQLPNVVDNDTHKKADMIRKKYLLSDAYDFANKSFLQSIVEAIPEVPQTMLKEHYRCQPQIISFCNKKFYNNELVIMSEDDGLNQSLAAIKTVEGNHQRGRYNQRQIDVIKEEILPTLDVDHNKIGIIAPYNEQVNELKKQIPDIDIATVHKFQGREKDVIILSTVDDQIKDFADDPYLLNVAVSRARKKLIVVVSGNKQESEGNITDLISYIQYNKLEVTDSKVYSVFDFLYAQYREKRWDYLRKHRKISQYDSENLTFDLIHEVLSDYPSLGVTCFTPLSMVVKDLSGLNEDEVKYLMNPATHLDFLIFNQISRQPVLAIETDGYIYHKKGTKQFQRDNKKNHILEICGIPLLRLSTNGSQEKEKIISKLSMINAL